MGDKAWVVATQPKGESTELCPGVLYSQLWLGLPPTHAEVTTFVSMLIKSEYFVVIVFC